MAKITLTDIGSGYGSTTVINANNALIETAIENTLSRNGTSPNQMQATLDMNSNRITNLPNATNNTEPVTLGQAASIQSFTGVVATAGAVGEVLWPQTSAEVSAGVTPTNYEYEPGNVLRYGTNSSPGTTDMTAAIQAAVDVVMTAMTNPTGTTGERGAGRVYLPKGEYLCTSSVNIGTQVSTRAFGLVIEGDAEYATSIVYSSDSGTLFSLTSYNSVTFQNMAIIHDDVTNIQTNRGSWTNVCFDLNGTGGGRTFRLNNVTTHGFNKVINIDGTINNDTNWIEGCTFWDGNICIYADNANAVVHHIQDCTFATEWNRVFDLSGFGHLTVQNCNFAISGAVLYLQDGADSFQNSRYVFDNCKIEFYAAYNGASDATTQFVVIPDEAINAQIHIRNCTMAGGKAVAAATKQFSIANCSLKLLVENSFIDSTAKIDIGVGGVQPYENRCYIRFVDCDEVPALANISYSGTATGSDFRIPVAFKRCVGVNDITLTTETTYADDSTHSVTFTPTTGTSPYIILGSGNKDYDYDLLSGQATFIEKIIVLVSNTSGLTSGTVEVFSDSGRTASIGSVAIADGTTTTPAAYEITAAADTVITDGLYFRSTNTNAGGGAQGMILIKYTNF